MDVKGKFLPLVSNVHFLRKEEACNFSPPTQKERGQGNRNKKNKKPRDIRVNFI